MQRGAAGEASGQVWAALGRRIGRRRSPILIDRSRYLEVAAPFAAVLQIINGSSSAWRETLAAASGRSWTQRCVDQGAAIVWQAWPECGDAACILVATLHDAVISTHVDLQLVVVGRDVRNRRHFTRRIDGALDRLQASWEDAGKELCPPPQPAQGITSRVDLVQTIERSHPQTVAAFKAMDALPALRAVAQLDRGWRATEGGRIPLDLHHTVPTLPTVDAQYDLIYAGGGLGLLHAAVMARRYGYRVLVFDRDEVGCAHREWNISDEELQMFERVGLFEPFELEPVIMRRYRDGVVRFAPEHAGVPPAELHLPAVLNVGLDAGELLRLARAKLEAAGGTVLDFRSFGGVTVTRGQGVAVNVVDRAGTTTTIGARLLLDGMGVASPLAQIRYRGHPFAGVCPTVGTVVAGLERGSGRGLHDPDVGDILVSVSDAQRRRQLIWEGFAGRDDELTVYVFYYDLVGGSRERLLSAQEHSLLDLYEDYFALLPSYKRPGAAFRHLKPVYGFIPARHTQRRTTVLPLPGVLPVGDSNAQQSPLTFCGFGSHVRNLDRTTGLLDYGLRHDLLAPEQLQHISAYQANVALNWVFSRFMQPWHAPDDVNRLQNVFARVLDDLGDDVAVRFFRDRMRWADYGRIVNHTLRVYRQIIATALIVLGPQLVLRWIGDYLAFSSAAAAAAVGRFAGLRRWRWLVGGAERVEPRWAFRLLAAWAEWEAMGWVEASPLQALLSPNSWSSTSYRKGRPDEH